MPRLIPIMLIHGFDGAPSHWIESGFRQHLIVNGDLDPNLVRTFDYGVAEDGTYNNRGDVRQVASRLAGANLSTDERLLCSIDQLSDNSVARGGPTQVTLICHSLGGIICRYYLSRSTPDEWGTVYRGNIGRLITIGTPHRGAELARVTDLAPRGSLIWWCIRLLERLGLAPARPISTVEKLDDALRNQQLAQRAGPAEARVMLTDTPVYSQLHPDSPFLTDLNRPGTLPSEIQYHSVYGDIRYTVRISANRLALVDRTVSFGDLVVTASSARDIPNVPCTSYPFVDETSLSMTLTSGPTERARTSPDPVLPGVRFLDDCLPAVSHCLQLSHPGIQQAVLGMIAP
jgi:pimeloyl-ACP methyl ester carboxylesterase